MKNAASCETWCELQDTLSTDFSNAHCGLGSCPGPRLSEGRIRLAQEATPSHGRTGSFRSAGSRTDGSSRAEKLFGNPALDNRSAAWRRRDTVISYWRSGRLFLYRLAVAETEGVSVFRISSGEHAHLLREVSFLFPRGKKKKLTFVDLRSDEMTR